MLGLLFAVAFTFAGPVHGEDVPIQPLPEPDNFERWFEHIDATDTELAWKTGIDWHQSFGLAINTASQHDKPVLLYIAAGDPQGCI